MFSAGLRAAGYELAASKQNPNGRPGDVLLIWNRYGEFDQLATAFERKGGTVIVAENGYLRGPKDSTLPGDYYALALDGHNGSGRWPKGDDSRWQALGIELKPWRRSIPTNVDKFDVALNGHVLVCPNRSFGTPGRIMPVDWPAQTARTLRTLTKREIRTRVHPGENKPQRPLADDLAGCWAMVVWYSSAGIHALIDGVPVICLAPAWIGREAAGTALETINGPLMLDGLREKAMVSLSHAQWSKAEIQSGTPFVQLREVTS